MGDKYVDCLVQESALAVTFHKKLKEVLASGKSYNVLPGRKSI